jgi:hypothetical protein
MITPGDELKRFGAWVRKVWAGSMGVVVALVLGLLLGVVYKQGDIVEDCRYAGSFRVHSQAFTCVRKI